MEFFPKVTNIDFMGMRKLTAFFSAVLFILSITSLIVYGLNLGLDFTGGSQIELRFDKAANITEIRNALKSNGFGQAIAQNYGPITDILISVPPHKGLDNNLLINKVTSLFPSATLRRNNFVGPKVGKELTTKGIMAIIISMVATMIYILMRFELRFAISSTVALIHDPVLILGVFSYFQLHFDLVALGAVLAILGFSLNDTVVVFDRVRENFRKIRKKNPSEVMNLSINQTLSRTVMTSGLTLATVVALYLFGGESLKAFSLVWIIGIVIGTYSSIYVAGSLAVSLGLNRQDFLPKAKPLADATP